MPAGTFAGGLESPGDGIPAAFPDGGEQLCRAVADAAAAEELWLAKIHAGLLSLLEFVDREPQWQSVLDAEKPLDGLLVSEATTRVHAALGEVLNAARGSVIVGAELTPSTTLIAELLVTAVLSVLRSRLLRGGRGRLVVLAPSLMSFIVEPYLGRGPANADLARDSSAAARAPAEAKVVPVRPHPRVVRMLHLIASAPGCSNRDVELAVRGRDASGSSISETLKRLEQRGLIENTRVGRVALESNAWHATPYGRRVLELVTDSHGQTGSREQQDRPVPRAPRRGRSHSSSHGGHVATRTA